MEDIDDDNHRTRNQSNSSGWGDVHESFFSGVCLVLLEHGMLSNDRET